MPIFKGKNENFFKTWSPDMAYVLGFFAADGSMYRNRRGGHYVEFQITDGDLLMRIRKLLGADHKITMRKLRPQWSLSYRLQIGSRVMFEDLERLGLSQNKSRILSLPNIPREHFGHFTRGYFDGDGNVWSGMIHVHDRPRPSSALAACFTSGSEDFLRSFKEKLEIYAQVGKGSLCYSSKGFRLRYAKKDSLRLCAFMYRDQCDLCLARKKKVFDDFLKN